MAEATPQLKRPLFNEGLKKLWIKQIKKMSKKGYTPDGLAKIYGTGLVAEALFGLNADEIMRRVQEQNIDLATQLLPGQTLKASTGDNTASITEEKP
jgi:hypothetical protein